MPRPVHRRRARMFLMGVVALTAVGGISYVGLTAVGGGAIPGQSYTYVTSEFEDVGVLRKQQPVKQNGVRIGEVVSIDYEDGRAVVTMRVEGDKDIHRNASADVREGSVLGRKYVELSPGTPSTGPLGDETIPASQTGDSTPIGDVFDVFDEPTRKALSSSLVELGGGVAGRSGDLRDAVLAAPGLLDGTGEVTAALASDRADLPSLLASANRLAGRFEGRQHELSKLLRQTDDTFRAVSVDNAEPLSEVVQALPETLRQAREGLQALNEPLADIHAGMDTVRRGGQALGASVDDLRGLLREAVEPLETVPDVSDSATPAVEDLTRTITDARPLVPRLSRTVGAASVLLGDLAPYSPDVGRFFSQHDLLSAQMEPNKHAFSFMLVMPGLYNASVSDPTVERTPYPDPGGGAWRDNRWRNSSATGGDG
ncbi:phospholipid/cholesterol/gamma-HCH transport system substrate-binding protein [Haloechinothrix alba]|uniref:Phospholipid/cholesterol/gamma-HCH transport system substrate-binding protein n=1 Tax=Haloechinothrix alba TaxID=664784 RepID=A0A239AAB1_9PSEU|nr:MlaD family protein [Haloechinothrix alba]SNR92342.1 phospholipid/cholesterol/gamma-HCH transport system substrate-binding protein [Haloechinothrix alba]